MGNVPCSVPAESRCANNVFARATPYGRLRDVLGAHGEPTREQIVRTGSEPGLRALLESIRAPRGATVTLHTRQLFRIKCRGTLPAASGTITPGSAAMPPRQGANHMLKLSSPSSFLFAALVWIPGAGGIACGS